MSMSKLQWPGAALLGPVPALLVTCGNGEVSNVFTAAWTGTVNTKPPKTYISVRPERYSYELIRQSGEFVLNLTPASLVRAVDFCGVRSGRDLNKFEACGLKTVPAFKVGCPVLFESPLSLECRVSNVIEMGSHHMFLADILCVDVEPSLLDAHGKLHMENAGLLAYLHGSYYTLGKKIGSFGYSVKKSRRSGRENRNKKP